MSDRVCATCGAEFDLHHETRCWFAGRVRERHLDHVVVPTTLFVGGRVPVYQDRAALPGDLTER